MPNEIIFYEAFAEEAEQLQNYLSPTLPARFTRDTIQCADIPVPPGAIVSVRTQSILPTNIPLEAVLTRSAGYDHVLRWKESAFTPTPCGYLPEYCVRAVAEQAMLLWTALFRKLPRQREQWRRFHRDGITGRELAGSTLVVVGVGKIGSEIARLGKSLAMRVIGVDLEEKHSDVYYLPVEEALPQADAIVCAMNLTEDNVGYFSCERFAQAERSPVFVNIARGEMSPATDLLQLLEENRLSGVGLDVYSNEQQMADKLRQQSAVHPDDAEALATLLKLRNHPNVLMTPHNAFNTQEAVQRKAQQSALQVHTYLEKGAFHWPVPDKSSTS